MVSMYLLLHLLQKDYHTHMFYAHDHTIDDEIQFHLLEDIQGTNHNMTLTWQFECGDERAVRRTFTNTTFSHLVIIQDVKKSLTENVLCMVNILTALRSNKRDIHITIVIEDNYQTNTPEMQLYGFISDVKAFSVHQHLSSGLVQVPRSTLQINSFSMDNNATVKTLLDSVNAILRQIKIFPTVESDFNMYSAKISSLQVVKNKVYSGSLKFEESSLLPVEKCVKEKLPRRKCISVLNNLNSYGNSNRRMDELDADNQDYIFTSYFSTKPDPQRQIQHEGNDITYLLRWYYSVKTLNLNAVIFHDGLSPEFMSKLTKDHPRLTFHLVHPSGNSLNDFRFTAYLSYLKANRGIKRVLCSDISDVHFQQNPFELMSLLGKQLYIGMDKEEITHMTDYPWMVSMLPKCKLTDCKDMNRIKNYKYLYNAGFIGGDRHSMMGFLEKVSQMLNETPAEHNCNMPVVNYVAHRYFDDDIFTGFPLTNLMHMNKGRYIGTYGVHK